MGLHFQSPQTLFTTDKQASHWLSPRDGEQTSHIHSPFLWVRPYCGERDGKEEGCEPFPAPSAQSEVKDSLFYSWPALAAPVFKGCSSEMLGNRPAWEGSLTCYSLHYSPTGEPQGEAGAVEVPLLLILTQRLVAPAGPCSDKEAGSRHRLCT